MGSDWPAVKNGGTSVETMKGQRRGRQDHEIQEARH